MLTKDGKIKWSPRIPKWKIRRLYETDARGIVDIDQIDDVGMILYMRCRDILTIYKAKNDRLVRCHKCEMTGKETFIPRHNGREELLTCTSCGWQITWLDYQKSFKRQQLNPGGAVTAFRQFVEAYPKAHQAREKILLIDSIIHAFHYSLRDQPDLPTRPAGVNLIQGKLRDVVALLDELSGVNTSRALQKSYREWRDKYDASYWPDIYDKNKSEVCYDE
jgi:hypothetical protein